MIFDREIFRRQAEGVPPHRIEHIIALQTLFSRNNIERSVGTGMPNMQPLPGWIREFHQRIIFRFAVIVLCCKGMFLVPHILPFFFNGSKIVLHSLPLL